MRGETVSKLVFILGAFLTSGLLWQGYKISDLHEQITLLADSIEKNQNLNLQNAHTLKDQNSKLLSLQSKFDALNLKVSLVGNSISRSSNENDSFIEKNEMIADADNPVLTTNKIDINSGDKQQDLFTKKMMSDPTFSPLENAREKFESESIDYSWASEYEARISELFSTRATLASMTIDQVTCKQTICKVSVYTGQDAIESATLIANVISLENWRENGASIIFNNKKNDGRINLYLGRKADSLQPK